MPKIIQKIREQLLQEAQKQIQTRGYAATTVRSVAEACGIGVGTVYNYFPSKDMLIATFMLEDWQNALAPLKNAQTSDAKTLLNMTYDSLQAYTQKHRALFQDKDAAKVFAAVSSEKHALLRKDIAAILAPVCAQSALENKAFLADFLAEAVLTWGIEDKPFSDLYPLLQPLIK